MHDERTANLLGALALNVADLILAEVRAAAGTSASASSALVVLTATPGLPVTELGRRTGLSQPAAARMVDSLESHGLVARRPGTGRSIAVHPTAAGRRAARRLLSRRGGVLGELLGDLGEAEQATLADLLSTMLRSVHGRLGRRPPVATGRVDELVCRMCDRPACTRDGATCPVGLAEREANRGG